LERLELELGDALLAFQDGDALPGGVELLLVGGERCLQLALPPAGAASSWRAVFLCVCCPCRCVLDLLGAEAI